MGTAGHIHTRTPFDGAEQIQVRRNYQRHGAAVGVVAITLVVLLGFAALAIDGGQLYLARTQLQVAADAAALASASAIVLDEGIVGDYLIVEQEGRIRGIYIASLHECLGRQIELSPTDITFGRIENLYDLNSPFISATTDYNAVRVVAARTTSSISGPITLFLAQIWGNDAANVRATAVAMMNDRMSGYNPTVPSLIPLTIWDELYEQQSNYTGLDEYGWDEDTNSVQTEPDGILEIHLYPYKLSGPSHPDEMFPPEDFEGEGNFGILNIGVDNQGQSPVAEQVIGGVTGEHLMAEFGTDQLVFSDEMGPVTFEATGNPGLMVALKEPFEQRIGDVIGFLLHSNVREEGSNAIYTIVGMRYGRIMDVRLTGNNKTLVIQPVQYAGEDVVTDPGAPPTDLEANRLMLVR